MNAITLRPERPVDLSRRLFLASLIPALVIPIAAAVSQIEAEKECKGGAFGAGFSGGFDVRHCDLVVKKAGDEVMRVPWPSQTP